MSRHAATGGGAADDDSGGPAYNVIEKENLGATWDCGDRPLQCVGDYVEFIDLARAYADRIPLPELWGEISACTRDRVPLFVDPEPAEMLRAQIVKALNLGFLVDGLDERPLVATTIRVDEADTYTETEVLFTDPWVGTFEGILLVPKGEGPFPAVLAIHGHDDTAAIYRDDYHGGDYPAHGYAILMLTMRAMGLDLGQSEHWIARELMLAGFDLIGLRVYESMLGLKYLRYLPEIDDARIGLIGHSGGSSASNLTVRVDPGIAAYVSDYNVDYCEWGTPWEPYHCETAPDVYPYYPLIRDFSTCATPVLQVPYRYTNGMGEIFAFFDEWLMP